MVPSFDGQAPGTEGRRHKSRPRAPGTASSVLRQVVRARDARSRPQGSDHHHIQPARDQRCMMADMLADPPEVVNRVVVYVVVLPAAVHLTVTAKSPVVTP